MSVVKGRQNENRSQLAIFLLLFHKLTISQICHLNLQFDSINLHIQMAQRPRSQRPSVDIGGETDDGKPRVTSSSTADSSMTSLVMNRSPCEDVHKFANHAGVSKKPDEVLSDEEDSASECAICLQPWSHPVQLPCTHIFCFLCVKGIANQSKKCALCRSEIPLDYLYRPNLLCKDQPLKERAHDGKFQWFYEGNRGWWMYDDRASTEIEEHFKRKDKLFEILIAGFLYVIDLDHMFQFRRNDPTRRRQIKRDLVTIPDRKGIAGIRYKSLGLPLQVRRDGDGGEADSPQQPPQQQLPQPSVPQPPSTRLLVSSSAAPIVPPAVITSQSVIGPSVVTGPPPPLPPRQPIPKTSRNPPRTAVTRPITRSMAASRTNSDSSASSSQSRHVDGVSAPSLSRVNRRTAPSVVADHSSVTGTRSISVNPNQAVPIHSPDADPLAANSRHAITRTNIVNVLTSLQSYMPLSHPTPAVATSTSSHDDGLDSSSLPPRQVLVGASSTDSAGQVPVNRRTSPSGLLPGRAVAVVPSQQSLNSQLTRLALDIDDGDDDDSYDNDVDDDNDDEESPPPPLPLRRPGPSGRADTLDDDHDSSTDDSEVY